MSATLLVAALAVSRALGQASYGSPSTFSYHGCAVVDLACFTDPIALPNGGMTHEACEKACQGYEFAAIFPNSCRCGNDASAVRPVDDSVCDNSCMGDPSLGKCGTLCPDHDSGTSTVLHSDPPNDDPASDTDPPASGAESSVVSPLETPIYSATGSSVGTFSSTSSQFLPGPAPPPLRTNANPGATAVTSDSGTVSPAPADDANPSGSSSETNIPVPSRVPGSESNQVSMPEYPLVGGLALAALLLN